MATMVTALRLHPSHRDDYVRVLDVRNCGIHTRSRNDDHLSVRHHRCHTALLTRPVDKTKESLHLQPKPANEIAAFINKATSKATFKHPIGKTVPSLPQQHLPSSFKDVLHERQPEKASVTMTTSWHPWSPPNPTIRHRPPKGTPIRPLPLSSFLADNLRPVGLKPSVLTPPAPRQRHPHCLPAPLSTYQPLKHPP